jgi:hypothetical protein
MNPKPAGFASSPCPSVTQRFLPKGGHLHVAPFARAMPRAAPGKPSSNPRSSLPLAWIARPVKYGTAHSLILRQLGFVEKEAHPSSGREFNGSLMLRSPRARPFRTDIPTGHFAAAHHYF